MTVESWTRYARLKRIMIAMKRIAVASIILMGKMTSVTTGIRKKEKRRKSAADSWISSKDSAANKEAAGGIVLHYKTLSLSEGGGFLC